MAENKIPLNDPGIAGYRTESWEGPDEPRFGEGVLTTTHETVTAGDDINLKLYSVITIQNGVIAMATHDGTESNAVGVLAAPIVMEEDQEMSVPIYREGHFEIDGLVWDASFNTDAKKIKAFEGSISPTIFVSRKKFKSSAIDI